MPNIDKVSNVIISEYFAKYLSENVFVKRKLYKITIINADIMQQIPILEVVNKRQRDITINIIISIILEIIHALKK